MTFRTPRRLLVPTDLGATSDTTIAVALGIASRFEGYVLLLHVFEPRLVHSVGEWALRHLDETMNRTRETAGRVLAAAAARHRVEGVTTRLAIQEGPPWRVIVDTAREQDMDLIVVGTGEHRTRGHRLLGGVAERVLRMAPCPVLTVPTVSRSAALTARPAI